MTLTKATKAIIRSLKCDRGSQALETLREIKRSPRKQLTSAQSLALKELEEAEKLTKRK